MSNIVEDDWKLIGYVITGCIGCVIITFLLIDLIRNPENQQALKNQQSQKYLSLLSISTALLLCFSVAVIKTNLIFRDLNHTANELPCKLSSAISGTFYIVSKFSMYLLFSYRIQHVFKDKEEYGVSKRLLITMRCIIIALAVIFCIVTNIPKKEEITTPIHNISHCTMKKGEFNKFGSIVIIVFVVTDFILLLWLLLLFNSKLYKMIRKTLTNGSEQNEQIDDLKDINKQLIKSTILVSTSIISTLFFVFIGVFLWKPLGWFMPFDMTVNALSIYLMYAFSGRMYVCCCYICIKCCSLCIPVADKEIFWNAPVGDKESSTSNTTETNSNRAHEEKIQLLQLPIENNQTETTKTAANNINL